MPSGQSHRKEQLKKSGPVTDFDLYTFFQQ